LTKIILDSIEGLKLKNSFGKLDIYEVNSKYFLPHIYPSNLFYLIDGSIENIFKKTSSENLKVGNEVMFLSSQISKSQLEFLEKYKNIEGIDTPIITFERINPTKYYVKVENANSPFFIVFSEVYSPQWRAYTENKPFNFNNIIAEYKSLGVKESRHEMKFTMLDISYLFKKSISEDMHFLANGYSNAWFVDPNEIGKNNFTIVLYFEPQTYYYLGITISTLTLIVCISYITWSFIKLKNRKL
jgi:hypothetical protein